MNFNEVTSPINCLVTGFDPFENQPFNPSEEIVNKSPNSVLLGKTNIRISLGGIVLPTCGEVAWPILESALNNLTANKRPCLVIMFGLAASRMNVNLERFALNIRDGDRKDNYGHIYNGQSIHKAAPQAIRTAAPIEQALLYLKKKGLPAEISNFCNTYVCNELYFQVLRYFERSSVKNYVSFVHLPLPKNYGKILTQRGTSITKKFANGKQKQLEAMKLIMVNLVKFYAEALLYGVNK